MATPAGEAVPNTGDMPETVKKRRTKKTTRKMKAVPKSFYGESEGTTELDEVSSKKPRKQLDSEGRSLTQRKCLDAL